MISSPNHTFEPPRRPAGLEGTLAASRLSGRVAWTLGQIGMKHLGTTSATTWPVKEDWRSRLLNRILFFITEANPGYRGKWPLPKG